MKICVASIQIELWIGNANRTKKKEKKDCAGTILGWMFNPFCVCLCVGNVTTMPSGQQHLRPISNQSYRSCLCWCHTMSPIGFITNVAHRNTCFMNGTNVRNIDHSSVTNDNDVNRSLSGIARCRRFNDFPLIKLSSSSTKIYVQRTVPSIQVLFHHPIIGLIILFAIINHGLQTVLGQQYPRMFSLFSYSSIVFFIWKVLNRMFVWNHSIDMCRIIWINEHKHLCTQIINIIIIDNSSWNSTGE